MSLRPLGFALVAAFLLLPIVWLVLASLDAATPTAAWPLQPSLDNYRRLLADIGWHEAYLRGLSYALVSTFLALAVALPAAYGFSRFRFLGDRPLFFWLLAGRLMPTVLVIVPALQMAKAWGYFDGLWAVALGHGLFTVPVAVWVLEGAISRVPRRIDELAYLEGWGLTGFVRRLLLPLIKGGVGAATFLCFVLSWSEFLIAERLASAARAPATARLAEMAASGETGLGVLAAAAVLTLLPGLLLAIPLRHEIAFAFALGRIDRGHPY